MGAQHLHSLFMPSSIRMPTATGKLEVRKAAAMRSASQAFAMARTPASTRESRPWSQTKGMTVATSMGGVSASGDQPAHRHLLLLSDHLRRGQLLWSRRCRHSCAHAQQVAWSIAGSRLRNTGSTPRRLVHLPAVPKKPDFDNRHGDRLHSSPIESTCSLEHVRAK
jgi:hypothetical protein